MDINIANANALVFFFNSKYSASSTFDKKPSSTKIAGLVCMDSRKT
jgi:hypothetical protein